VRKSNQALSERKEDSYQVVGAAVFCGKKRKKKYPSQPAGKREKTQAYMPRGLSLLLRERKKTNY